jgi:myo-inositol catabolism protein IolC
MQLGMVGLGYEKPLYMLAFDHRGSFQKDLFGITGTPDPSQSQRISDAKQVISEAFELVLRDGIERGALGMLVDEQYGADIARRAKRTGAALAMPVEKSGQAEFDFEFGADFGHHIEEFDPTFSKVLVRFNPEGDGELNKRQAERLRELSEWLHERGRKFLFELLVPATQTQLERVGGDATRYDLEIRPKLTVDAIRELQEADVEPDIWKVEGLDAREDCERVAGQARSGDRPTVACIVLGRGADKARVKHWLEQGSGVRGYIGFAIGRTLWWQALTEYIADALGRAQAASIIAANYREMIDTYRSAESVVSE